ncbi:S-adenosyl-L-methionine-dependent methyltransferase [Annulohypoxylon maeteangense]|uniref:S-adenosyl-L-methionine-dependent methyltransferase n=1 Tax=Annulohypoxylon maeteangense TaxID=1927788 RepID=UPI0020079970|nr:S-adenosyl-L-methionine-dependent methyltransferase [Annulohypoxylon maeteangense]KAI0880245.1 S-adenosyl-L-methionine-dependent methyltransferase [Annulohypoxylon maeteangense]
MASPNRIVELSSTIARETAKLDSFFTENGLPTPSLEADALWTLPIPESAKDLQMSRVAIMEACTELKALVTGPKTLLRSDWTAYSSVKTIIRFNLDKSFPIGESTSFEAMSSFSGLSVSNIQRIVRHAIINHNLFLEKTPGVITHSILTAITASDEMARAALLVELDEFWPAATKLADALQKWPNSEENTETGFNLAHNTDKSMYETFAEDPARAENFGKYFFADIDPPNLLPDNYPWKGDETVVDVGGSHGSMSISLAKRFPNMKCIVQDLKVHVEEGAARLPAELKDRVTFMPHNFFNKQTVVGDVYYFRCIFHNWADKYCIQILRNLIPVLKPGAKIVIHDRMMPDTAIVNKADARRTIIMDIGMLQLLNAKERGSKEWPELFRQADPRFKYLGARHPPDAMRWIIDAEWQG